MKKIYVGFKRPKTVAEFITKLFDNKHIYGEYYSSVTTFYDKECINIQCYKNKYRSFDDVYLIIKTYYPSYNRSKLMKVLITLTFKKEDKIYSFFPVYCETIDKYTFKFRNISSWHNISWFDSNIKHSWKKLCKSKYTWSKLFNMINIKTTEDYEKAIQIN